MGPRGACSFSPLNERPAEQIFRLDLSRFWADVWSNSYVDSTRFGGYQVTVHLTSIGNPLIEGAYFSAFTRATTKLDRLYPPPLGQGWYKLLPVLTPWAGAKK